MARAWAPEAIERAAGVPARTTGKALRHANRLTAEEARALAGAYDALWDRQPPMATQQDRDAAASAQAHAQRCGWAPPMAWEDDEIDLPDGRPADGWRRTDRHTRPAADLVEDAQFVREAGGYRLATNKAVAMRLGVSRDVLDRAYERVRERAAMADREAG